MSDGELGLMLIFSLDKIPASTVSNTKRELEPNHVLLLDGYLWRSHEGEEEKEEEQQEQQEQQEEEQKKKILMCKNMLCI